jgi:uncharacterized membrane protein YkoI
LKEESNEAKITSDDDDDDDDDDHHHHRDNKSKKKKKANVKKSPLKQTMKPKSAKKGYATAKQRLGKILKINRIFNI